MLTNPQKKALHVAARAAGVRDDEQRHIIQWNLGGFYSAADSTAGRYGFICVMAYYEDRCDGCLPRGTPKYWALERDRNSEGSAAQHAIRQEAAALGWTGEQLDRFVGGKHMTGGAFECLDDLPPYWLRKVREALKAMVKRKARDAAKTQT
jgi:hypothetical protein